MIKLRDIINEIEGKEDMIGGIVNGEVRAVNVTTGRVKFHTHNEFPGLFSGQNNTNWRYHKKTNKVIWNQQPAEEDVHLLDNFLDRKGIKNVKHTLMYRY